MPTADLSWSVLWSHVVRGHICVCIFFHQFMMVFNVKSNTMHAAALSWAMPTYYDCILLLQRPTFSMLVDIPVEICS